MKEKPKAYIGIKVNKSGVVMGGMCYLLNQFSADSDFHSFCLVRTRESWRERVRERANGRDE